MYEQGDGVGKNPDKAAYWYKKSAEQDSPEAQNNLGHLYEVGEGVPKDYNEAVQWYARAANLGHAVSQLNLGRMYTQGKGVPKDYVVAYTWYTLAIFQGNQTATKWRILVANEMTPAQIDKAEEMAREWKPPAPQAK